MRKIVSTLFVSLDGVVEAPDKWSLAYWNDEIAQTVGAAMAVTDAMLLGRVTYQGFAEAWPGRTAEDDEGAAFMNSVRKYVVSTTLTSVEWQNSVLLQGDPGDAVRALKASSGRDILTSGSPTLVRWLLSEGLVDELNLLVFPIVVGAGKRLFAAEGPQYRLKLGKSVQFANGVLHVVYRPSKDS